MSADRPTLYGPELLALARAPRHTGVLRDPTHTERRDNPLCGDRISLQLRVVDGVVRDVAHQTRGCALCLASASVLGDQVRDRSIYDALEQAHAVLSELEEVMRAPTTPASCALQHRPHAAPRLAGSEEHPVEQPVP